MKTGGPSAPVYRGARSPRPTTSCSTAGSPCDRRPRRGSRSAGASRTRGSTRTCSAAPRAARRGRRWASRTATIVASVGRFVPFKGMDVLAAASAEILRDRRRASSSPATASAARRSRPALAGSASRAPRPPAPALDRIGVRQLLADADLFVIPSVVTPTARPSRSASPRSRRWPAAWRAWARGSAGSSRRSSTARPACSSRQSQPGRARRGRRPPRRPGGRADGQAGHERAWRQFGGPPGAREVAAVYREVLAARPKGR